MAVAAQLYARMQKYTFDVSKSDIQGCAIDGSYIGADILGRCQHPITAG